MKKNKIIPFLFSPRSFGERSEVCGFTIIELIVVITIISILGTISFISFSGSVNNSRDTTRKADMVNLKVSLKGFMQKSGYYPNPSNKFSITNSGVAEVYQGFLDSNIEINTLENMPKDPINNLNYFYGVTKTKQEFQIAMTFENSGKPIAYVDGDYKTLTKNLFPSLLLATISGSGQSIEIQNGVGDGALNRQKFILNGGSYNLPYDFKTGAPQVKGNSFSGVINEYGITIPSDNTYPSCADIYNGQKYMGIGIYEILADYGAIINNTCDCSSGTNTTTCQSHDNTLVGYWDMESMDSGKLRDLSGNGNNGTMNGTTSTGGKVGNSREFNGTSEYINIGKNINQSDGTIGLWFKSNGSVLINAYIFGQQNNNPTLSLLQDSINQKLNFWVRNSAGISFELHSLYAIDDEKWHNATINWGYDGLKLYVDGIINSSDNSTIFDDGSSSYLIFGGINTSSSPSYLFPGLIDEVRIYNQALSDQEVLDYYNATKTGF